MLLNLYKSIICCSMVKIKLNRIFFYNLKIELDSAKLTMNFQMLGAAKLNELTF